jgi:hypothetical protein
MTKGQLLATADSMELTEWQAYLTAVAQEKAESKDGRRIRWNPDD